MDSPSRMGNALWNFTTLDEFMKLVLAEFKGFYQHFENKMWQINGVSEMCFCFSSPLNNCLRGHLCQQTLQYDRSFKRSWTPDVLCLPFLSKLTPFCQKSSCEKIYQRASWEAPLCHCLTPGAGRFIYPLSLKCMTHTDVLKALRVAALSSQRGKRQSRKRSL